MLHCSYKSYLPLFLLPILLWTACEDDNAPPIDLSFDPDREIAEGVKMIYSDSAVLQFTIETPRLEKYQDGDVLVEYFPQGLLINFYDESGVITSSISANLAERRASKGTMLLRDSVVLINKDQDQLITPGILWDETNKTLNTNKLVKLIRSSSQDTLYGFGFSAVDDFSKFSIKKVTGKRQYESIVED